MTNHKLLRALITFSVSVMKLFFKIKGAKVDRVYVKRLPTTSKGRATRAGPSPSHPYVGVPIGVGGQGTTLLHTQETTPQSCERAEYVEYSAQSRLPKQDGFIKFYFLFTHLAYWYFLLKNIFISLMRSETFASWRYLDCFLPGRFIVNGRTIEVAHFCACYLIITRVGWRYIVARRSLELRLPCLEFLLGSQEQHEPYWSRESAAPKVGKVGPDCEFHSTLLEFYNPFAQVNGERPFKLRPNRTREAWHLLAAKSIRFYKIFSVIFMIIVSTFLRMGLPVVLTQRGFAYSYRYCIQWIMSNRRQAGGRYSAASINGTSSSSTRWSSHVYDLFVDRQTATTESLWRHLLSPVYSDSSASRYTYTRPKIIQDIFMPFTGFVGPSLFHILRSILELTESVLIYCEAAMHFSAACFLTVVLSNDIVLYCETINERLRKLIVTLRQDTGDDVAFKTRRSHYYDMIHLGRDTGKQRQDIKRQMLLHDTKFVAIKADTSDIQAMIADMFLAIDAYNKYLSLQTMWLIFAWFGYSAMVSSWIFIPGNESPKLEWYVIHACSTCYMFLMMSSMSSVETSCRQLYNLIAVAMALDENFETSKSVWVSLLKFYSPRSLYCFTMIGSIEITNMLGLKILVWLVSALIVASSFFQVYNIK